MVGRVHLDTDHGARKLHVGNITTSTRVDHHGNTGIHVRQLILQERGNLIVNVSPGIHCQVVTLFFGDQTLVKLFRDQSRFSVTLSHELRDFVEVDVVGHTG